MQDFKFTKYVEGSLSPSLIALACGLFDRDEENAAFAAGYDAPASPEFPHAAQSDYSEFSAQAGGEQANSIWADDSDPAEEITIDGKSYWLKRSEQEKIVYKMAKNIEDWFYERRIILDGTEYAHLLLNIRKMLTSHFPIGNPKTPADRWMSEELARELRYRFGI
ncbi:MAG: hypothetical protein FWC65_00325 [Treponema sp.]|nr:hypothetical protein [Treponema sp.]